MVIDTSASMASRLFLVKDKLYRLMQVGALVKYTIMLVSSQDRYNRALLNVSQLVVICFSRRLSFSAFHG